MARWPWLLPAAAVAFTCACAAFAEDASWHFFLALIAADALAILLARQQTNVRRHAERLAAVSTESLTRSEAMLRRLFHNAPVGHCYLDPVGICLAVNAPWTDIVGGGEEDAAGIGWRNAFIEAEQPRLMAILAAARKDLKRVSATLRLAGATQTWGRFDAQPLLGAEGELEGFITTLEDVTEEKRVAEAAANRHALLQALITNAPVAMAMLDKELKYTVMSGKWRELFGLSDKPAPGLRFADHCPARFERFKALQQVALAKAAMLQDREDVVRDEDGHETYLNWAIHPVLSAGGECAGVVTVLHEVTDLVAAKAAALATARFKADFLAHMSHELRTPMGGVFGMTELLRKTPLSNEQREFVSVLDNSGRHLLHVINDILDYTKIEVGKLTLESIPFDLAEVVHEAMRLFAEQAAQKGLELAAIFPPAMGSEFTGDPGRIKQILANLVGNAVKFTERGHVLVSVDAGADGVRFEVADTGAGMAAATEAKLFKPFAQADASTTRRFGGSGLGLTICRQLVELMGGSIGVDSREGVGSKFWLELPLASVPELAPLVRLAGKALVLGRHPQVGAAIAATLKRHGLDVALVSTPQEAAELLRGAIDYVVVDMAAYDTGRLSFVKSLPALNTEVRGAVLLVPFGRDAAALEPFGHVLMKPVRLDLLAAALRRAESEADDARERAQGPAPLPELGRIMLRGKVLVVDDNELNRHYAGKVVERLGFKVEMAVDGKEAVVAGRAGGYDLILMDCHMPDVDGYEATRRLRALGVTTTIVAVTASTLPDERERCVAAGMDDILVKPVRFDAFRALLDGRCGPPVPMAAGEIQLPVLDEALFSEWIGTLDAAEAIASALTSVERNVESLRAALELGDARLSADVAHKLAGSAALLGGTRLRAVSASIERMARGGDLRSAGQLGDPLMDEALAFADLVRKRIAA